MQTGWCIWIVSQIVENLFQLYHCMRCCVSFLYYIFLVLEWLCYWWQFCHTTMYLTFVVCERFLGELECQVCLLRFFTVLKWHVYMWAVLFFVKIWRNIWMIWRHIQVLRGSHCVWYTSNKVWFQYKGVNLVNHFFVCVFQSCKYMLCLCERDWFNWKIISH